MDCCGYGCGQLEYARGCRTEYGAEREPRERCWKHGGACQNGGNHRQEIQQIRKEFIEKKIATGKGAGCADARSHWRDSGRAGDEWLVQRRAHGEVGRFHGQRVTEIPIGAWAEPYGQIGCVDAGEAGTGLGDGRSGATHASTECCGKPAAVAQRAAGRNQEREPAAGVGAGDRQALDAGFSA